MARKPVILYGPTGRRVSAGRGWLYEAAQWQQSSPWTPLIANDIDYNVGSYGNRELMAAGRILYANCPELANAIDLIGELAVGTSFEPEFYGQDQGWGDRACELLREWHRICDVRGGVFDWTNDLKLMSVTIDRDRDIGILFCETPSGYPQIQLIPPHRIGSLANFGNAQVDKGPYKDMPFSDGVIFNEQGRAIAYRVYTEDGKFSEDISAITVLREDGTPIQTADMMVAYNPKWCDQGRGICGVANAVLDWRDIVQVKKFWKAALKKESSYAAVEYNEAGMEVDPNADNIDSTTGPNGGAIWEEKVEGGATLIYRSQSGSKIEFPEANRPSVNHQAYWQSIARNAFYALGWPYEFYDAMSRGKANLLLVMELVQPIIERRQALLQKVASRIDRWRVAKAIKSGELPYSPDWLKISHTPPEQMTVDRGYSAEIDRQDYILGFSSLRRVAARRGERWRQLRDEQAEEVDDLLTRAKETSAKFGITIELALSLLQQRTANPALAPQPNKAKSDEATSPPAAKP